MNKIYEFKIDSITLEEYNFYVNELSLWYKEELKCILKLYEELLHSDNTDLVFVINRRQRDILNNIIIKILELLNIDGKYFGVYLSNSYARGTNLLDSDIDINFIYDDPKYKAYEELISSMIADIYSKYRDFVHDSIPHRLINSDMSEDDKISVKIIFPDDTLEHEITKGNRILMDRTYRASNRREDFIKYYIDRINNDLIEEWIYFQEPINEGIVTDVLDYIKTLENSLRWYNIDKYIDRLREEIENLKKEIEASKLDSIELIKNLFKNKAFKIIYEYLVLVGKIKHQPFDYKSVEELLESDSKETTIIREYFKEIILIGYLCQKYGIEFRTRYHQDIPNDFLKYYQDERGIDLLDNLKGRISELLDSIMNSLKGISYEHQESYEEEEHINIANYSPLSHINNVSKEYQNNYFLLPFIDYRGMKVPVHPDMFADLGLSYESIIDKRLVFPTSSTRTVYDKNDNICYKLAVLRQITRSIRNMSQKELDRSIIASSYLSRYSYPNFYIIPEDVNSFSDENFNYIVRKMPERRVYPWFYLIVSNRFSKEFMMKVISRIIDVWFFYASKGIYFESFHTQNLLVDDDGNLYYRDLSDIRILEEDIMCPSYLDELDDEKELHSIFFDRSVLSQNIEHFIRYRKDITHEDIELIKMMIKDSIEKYDVKFPNYSMNYDKNRKGHHPIKTDIARLRKV